jgi:tetratricopeptide (TPR) repeat protein
MFFRGLKYILVILIMHATIDPRAVVNAQTSTPNSVSSGSTQLANAGALIAVVDTATLEVYLKRPDEKPVEGAAVVTLLKLSKQFYRQETAKAGYIRFNSIAPTEYFLQVIVPGYETAMKQVETYRDEVKAVTIELRQLSVEDAAAVSGYNSLAPKTQKEMGKALEALRANKAADARSHLDAANRMAPHQAEVEYLYGVYSLQTGNAEQAKSYWMKAVESNPRHFLALLSLADALLREKRATEALPYVTRAVEAEPSSWRAHAILANTYLLLGSNDEAVKQAERAMELGHGQAAIVQPILAEALARRGEKTRAIALLQTYLQEHPSDGEAKKLQERLQTDSTADMSAEASARAAEELSIFTSAATSLPLPSNWLPPDVDEKVPPVEPGASCALEEVVRNAGKRMQEFVSNVDRFTATEDLIHKSVNKFGFSSVPETRKFDYVVSIEESRPGFLNVEEYRRGPSGQNEFPDGVATNGLPALALIFHPVNAKNFAMTCEGLGRWSGGLVWQIHFRQRADRPNTMRAYRLGMNGPAYPVALRGRAWIAADSYQIVRLETDLVTPLPEIRLLADHTAIEYGPVRFRNRNLEMWLPQSAEVYYDWRGRRSHRRHSFSNYLLFSVDEKQRISEPKTQN